MAEIQSTTLSRQWLFKTGAFIIVLLGFGIWALADAMVFYPRRGMRDSSFQFKNWLEAADHSGQLNVPAFTIADPRAVLANLEPREAELRALAPADAAKLDYLRSLSSGWSLNTSPKFLGEPKEGRRLYFDPATGTAFTGSGSGKTSIPLDSLRAELAAMWKTSAQPTPLSSYDLPVQWIFTLGGLGGGLYILFTALKARTISRKITWEEDSQTLSLPGGASFTPSDLTEVDKRLWHKFYVTLATKDGAKHKLDLLRYSPLEDWVVSMERTAFPESAKEDAPEGESVEPAPETSKAEA